MKFYEVTVVTFGFADKLRCDNSNETVSLAVLLEYCLELKHKLVLFDVSHQKSRGNDNYRRKKMRLTNLRN